MLCQHGFFIRPHRPLGQLFPANHRAASCDEMANGMSKELQAACDTGLTID